MATLIKVFVAVFIGIMVGLLVTIYSLDQANRNNVVGPWRSAPRDGSGEIDPYALAANARASLLPLGSSEGLSFYADTDSKDVGLASRCDYAVVGPIPSARFWTLSVLTPEGFPIANLASRYGFTSADALRISDDPIRITISSEASSGNWLPTGKWKHFVLMLRLYDTGLSTVGTVLKASAMPSIGTLACR